MVSVQAGPPQSVTMHLAGDTSTDIIGVRHLDSYAPTAGDTVWVLQNGSDYLIIGSLTSSPPPAFKAANQIVNNSTTLVNDTALVVPVVANGVYSWQALVKWASGTTPDFKMDLALPASANHDSIGHSYFRDGAAAAGADSRMFSGAEVLAIPGAGTSWSTQGRLTLCTGYITVAGTAGNAQIRWAQNAANASDTTVFANSWMRLSRIA
ncbi:MAG: hypothetical protein ACREF4_10715 [Gammaproteobacteria bacterium]